MNQKLLANAQFKMATEDGSIYRPVSIIAINWFLSLKRLNKNLQTRAWNEEKLPSIHWIRTFWPISKFKMATDDWSVYRRVPIIAINWIFFQNSSTKTYKLKLEMKKNYQGYIESENSGQSRSFVASKMTTKDWSAYRRMSIIVINRIFLQNGLTKIYKRALEMKKSYQGYIESEQFGQIWDSWQPKLP